MNEAEHLLTIAAEECAEVAHRLSKALRFGMDEIQSDVTENPERLTNRERIYREYWQLRATLGLAGIDAWHSNEQSRNIEAQKVAKVRRFLEYSRAQGTLAEK